MKIKTHKKSTHMNITKQQRYTIHTIVTRCIVTFGKIMMISYDTKTVPDRDEINKLADEYTVHKTDLLKYFTDHDILHQLSVKKRTEFQKIRQQLFNTGNGQKEIPLYYQLMSVLGIW